MMSFSNASSSMEDSVENEDDKIDDDDESPRTSQAVKMKTFKKKSKQKFLEEWKKTFSWATSSLKGSTFFECKYCPKPNVIACANDGIYALKRHETRQKHIKSIHALGSSRNVLEMCKKQGDTKIRARTIELQIAMLIVDKNLPLSLSDDIVDLLKKIDIDRSVQSQLSCNRTKCTALVQNVLGRNTCDELISILQKNYFTLIIDDSTDLSTKKNLVMCARFAAEDVVQDQFLALLEVVDSTHKGHFDVITKFFNDNNIPYKDKMVGFAADGANVMFGEHNSVATKLKQEVPNLFTFKCICHSLALAVSYAVKCIPPEIEKMISNIFCYLKYSSKRQLELKCVQKLLDIPEHKLLRLFKLRWLSLSAVLDRYLEQYDALFEFFQKESQLKANDQDKAVEIFQRLRSRWTICYMQFLQYVVPIVSKQNLEFQAERPQIHMLYGKMECLFKKIVSMYLTLDYVEVTDVEYIEFKEITDSNKRNWEPLRNVSLGPQAKKTLLNLATNDRIPSAEIDHFRSTCRAFLITLADQIYTRFPFKNKEVQLLREIGFIQPEVLKNTRDITVVADFFGFDVVAVDEELTDLRRRFKDNVEMDMTIFWKKVREAVGDYDGKKLFPLILDIYEKVRVLPHSSAQCERVFSAINLNKTKVRNSLDNATLSGILHGKSLTKKHETITDINCQPMLKLINSDMYAK